MHSGGKYNNGTALSSSVFSINRQRRELGTILLDSVNMDESVGKVTRRDQDALLKTCLPIQI